MKDQKNIPENLKEQIEKIKNEHGENLGLSIEALTKKLLGELQNSGNLNPREASSMFLARPTGYVI